MGPLCSNSFFSPNGNFAVPLQPLPTHNCCAQKSGAYSKAALILFLVGFFTYVCYIASIAISLHMVNKGYIVKRKAAVLAFSILELFGWVFVASFVWFYQDTCFAYSPYYGYYDCYTIWWGWISLVVWGTFALCFGIPRVIFTWQYDVKNQNK